MLIFSSKWLKKRFLKLTREFYQGQFFMLNFLATIEPLIWAIHIIICIFMTISILLQAGKGADMGATFGAGSSQTLFGARGAATFLSKLTTVAAICFLLTSISLASIKRNQSDSNLAPSVLTQTDLAKPTSETKPVDVPSPAATPSEENKK